MRNRDSREENARLSIEKKLMKRKMEVRQESREITWKVIEIILDNMQFSIDEINKIFFINIKSLSVEEIREKIKNKAFRYVDTRLNDIRLAAGIEKKLSENGGVSEIINSCVDGTEILFDYFSCRLNKDYPEGQVLDPSCENIGKILHCIIGVYELFLKNESNKKVTIERHVFDYFMMLYEKIDSIYYPFKHYEKSISEKEMNLILFSYDFLKILKEKCIVLGGDGLVVGMINSEILNVFNVVLDQYERGGNYRTIELQLNKFKNNQIVNLADSTRLSYRESRYYHMWYYIKKASNLVDLKNINSAMNNYCKGIKLIDEVLEDFLECFDILNKYILLFLSLANKLRSEKAFDESIFVINDVLELISKFISLASEYKAGDCLYRKLFPEEFVLKHNIYSIKNNTLFSDILEAFKIEPHKINVNKLTALSKALLMLSSKYKVDHITDLQLDMISETCGHLSDLKIKVAMIRPRGKKESDAIVLEEDAMLTCSSKFCFELTNSALADQLIELFSKYDIDVDKKSEVAFIVKEFQDISLHVVQGIFAEFSMAQALLNCSKPDVEFNRATFATSLVVTDEKNTDVLAVQEFISEKEKEKEKEKEFPIEGDVENNQFNNKKNNKKKNARSVNQYPMLGMFPPANKQPLEIYEQEIAFDEQHIFKPNDKNCGVYQLRSKHFSGMYAYISSALKEELSKNELNDLTSMLETGLVVEKSIGKKGIIVRSAPFKDAKYEAAEDTFYIKIKNASHRIRFYGVSTLKKKVKDIDGKTKNIYLIKVSGVNRKHKKNALIVKETNVKKEAEQNASRIKI